MSEGLDDGFRLIVTIAEALRDEFGVEIDAHPGGEGIEAGEINRAFLTVAGMLVSPTARDECDLTRLLHQVALRRLRELGVHAEVAEVLIASESRLGRRWLAYLALAPITVIDDLTNHLDHPTECGGTPPSHQGDSGELPGPPKR